MGDKLSVGTLIQNGIQLALKNFVALIVNGILFVLTIWIPYINIGTMIGMYTLPAKMGRDQGISMTEIFDRCMCSASVRYGCVDPIARGAIIGGLLG